MWPWKQTENSTHFTMRTLTLHLTHTHTQTNFKKVTRGDAVGKLPFTGSRCRFFSRKRASFCVCAQLHFVALRDCILERTPLSSFGRWNLSLECKQCCSFSAHRFFHGHPAGGKGRGKSSNLACMQPCSLPRLQSRSLSRSRSQGCSSLPGKGRCGYVSAPYMPEFSQRFSDFHFSSSAAQRTPSWVTWVDCTSAGAAPMSVEDHIKTIASDISILFFLTHPVYSNSRELKT